MVRATGAYRSVPRGEIVGQAVGDERFPVEIVRVAQDRTEARRFDIGPGRELAVPGAVERGERAILAPKPRAKRRLRRPAVAELRVRDVIDLGPIDDVRLTPEIPAVETRIARRDARHGGVEIIHELPDFRIVGTESWRYLRRDRDAALRDEAGIGIRFTDPVRGRV